MDQLLSFAQGYRTYLVAAAYAVTTFLVMAGFVDQETITPIQNLLIALGAATMRAAIPQRLQDYHLLLVALLFATPASAQIQLMPAEKLAAFRAALPQIKDGAWHTRIHDPRNIVYTDREIPRAYQMRHGFHSPAYNVSGDPTDAGLAHGQGGNANVDFPWEFPGGTDYSAKRIHTTKQLLLPLDSAGRVLPIVWYQEDERTSPFDEDPSVMKWTFPVGTQFTEVLQTEIDGRWPVFEIRVRIRAAHHWDVEVFRPFPRCEDLAVRLEAIDATAFAPTIAALRRPERLTEVDLTNRANPRPGFVGKTGVAWLPPLAPETAAALLLTTPFEIATGAEWKKGSNGVTCYAPTTDLPGQLVPTHYAGSIVGTDTVSCAKCHDGALKHARHFNMARGWYGRVRGNDEILSFHPIDPSSISYHGGDIHVRLRPAFVQAGLIERFDFARHPAETYSPLKK